MSWSVYPLPGQSGKGATTNPAGIWPISSCRTPCDFRASTLVQTPGMGGSRKVDSMYAEK